MKKVLLLFDLILSVALGFILNYYISSNIIAIFFQGMNSLYVLLSMIMLIMQILFIFILIRLCRTKKINNYVLKFLFALYICIMLMLLFGRDQREASISMTIYPLVNFLDFEVLFQNIFNVILFLPIGYLLKNKSTKHTVLYAFIGVITVEAIQLFTKRGIFDICDIILNMLGIIIGYYFTKNILCKFEFSN